jgi:PTS system mannose-specific IID component
MDRDAMISSSAIKKVFLGSFFIQSSWSFSKMQGLGFAAALSPALRELFADDRERVESLKRHTEYYNSHPYMASPILGAVIKLEETAAQGRGDELAGRSFKEALMGPYGSIGDGFFWAMVRPVAALIGIVATFFIGLWGPVIFLGVYNAFHIWMRWKGLKWGYEYGVRVIDKVGELNLPVWTSRGRYLGSALLGVASFLLVLEVLSVNPGLSGDLSPGFKEWTPLVVEAAFIASAIILSELSARVLNFQRFIYVVLLLVLILGMIFS